MAGKIYYPDAASYQAGINVTGWLALMAKATEGTGYVNPGYQAQKAEAARRGAKFGAYHFLHAGNAAAQADHAFSVTGRGVPLMIDLEPTTGVMWHALRLPIEPGGVPRLADARAEEVPEGLEDGHLARLGRVSDAEPRTLSSPGVAGAVTFCDRYRTLGGTVHLLYFPRWYWVQLGRPSLAPLASRGLHLVTSNYSGSPEADSGPGWATYGGMPEVCTWQYTSTGTVNGMDGVDLNCFRGSGSGDVQQTLRELWSLWTTGSLTAPPAPEPTIRRGSSGPAVTLAQQRLNAWHASPPLKVDGQFGTKTFQATQAFQHARGLAADGVVGPLTWMALDQSPP